MENTQKIVHDLVNCGRLWHKFSAKQRCAMAHQDNQLSLSRSLFKTCTLQLKLVSTVVLT